MRKQQFRQWFQPGFLGDFRFGAALGFEGQVDILKAPLAVCGKNGCFQRGVEFTLLAN